MPKIVVTGGSGKAGRAVIRDLLDHGYEVLNVDKAASPDPVAPFIRADLTELGQTFEVLSGADGVVHLAAIPAPGQYTPEYTFDHNTGSTFNIFTAATQLGMKRVVWASSETVLGLPFDREKPTYAPIDEAHTPYPNSTYALSKMLSEEMARQFSRWSGTSFVGLRFSNIMEIERYQQFPGFWDDPLKRKWNLWGYVDARDVGQSCRLGLEADIDGAEVFIIAAADTVMTRPNRELIADVFPETKLRPETGDFDTLLGIDKARQMLGYNPQFSWRDHISPKG
jgi:nucleoside-diphosphate-sugar epimerase